MTGTSHVQRHLRGAAALAVAGFAIAALPACQSAGGQPAQLAAGPGCAPLPSFSAEVYPLGTAAGAGEIRVSPSASAISQAGDTETITITACSGPVHWSASAPSYVTLHPASGTLRTGQHVQVHATYSKQGVLTRLVIDPGHYVEEFSYTLH